MELRDESNFSKVNGRLMVSVEWAGPDGVAAPASAPPAAAAAAAAAAPAATLAPTSAPVEPVSPMPATAYVAATPVSPMAQTVVYQLPPQQIVYQSEFSCQ